MSEIEKLRSALESAESINSTALEMIAKLRAAIKPFAAAADTLDMPQVNGFPFDDPNEVLWAGEGGLITVADFRRCQEALA